MSISHVVEHLEFLGFDSEVTSKDGDESGFISAKHPSRWNLRISVESHSMYLSTGVILEDKSFNYEATNSLNREIGAVRVALDDDGDLMCSVFYFGSYERKSFAFALESIEGAVRPAIDAVSK